MKKIRMIVVGFGFMGQTHAGSISRMPDAELVAVVDPADPANLSRSSGNIRTRRIEPAALAGVPFFKTLSEALARVACDAVVIAAPTAFHAENLLTALAAGKHVFVEKPLCADLAEAEKIRIAAEAAGRIIQVGYVTRFKPAYRHLADAVESGEYGKMRGLFLQRYTGAPAWRAAGGGNPGMSDAIIDLCIHDIDFAISLFGEPEAVDVDPAIRRHFGTSLLESSWRFHDGPPVRIEGGFLLPPTVPFRAGYLAMFEFATLEFGTDDAECAIYTHEGGSVIPFPPDFDEFEAEMRCFRDCVAAGRQPGPDFRAAYTDMVWIDKLYHPQA